MTRVFVCTHSRHDLALGAVAAITRHAADVSSIAVIDSSGTFRPLPGVTVERVECPQYFHHVIAKRIAGQNEPTVCIDDDVRLVRDVILADRYGPGWHKPGNGHMVQVWVPGQGYTRLSQWRTSRRCEGLTETLCGYAAAANAEQVDGIWIHIDKGSAAATPERDALVRYLDAGPGLGDVVADTLSAVGITKRRVSRLLGRPCGCKKRQAWLNRLVPAVPGLSRRPQ